MKTLVFFAFIFLLQSFSYSQKRKAFKLGSELKEIGRILQKIITEISTLPILEIIPIKERKFVS